MMNKSFISFFIIFAFYVGLSASPRAVVEFKSSAEVGNALNFQLEDLITLENPSATTIRSIMDLDVPFKGSSISNQDISVWIKTVLKERPELRQVLFKVPQAIEIKRIDGLVKTQIRQRIQTRLNLKCLECLFQVQISNVPEVKTKHVLLDWKNIPLSGAFMLPITTAEGQNLSWISGQIKSQREVVKAARVFRAGDTVQDSDLSMEMTDISFAKDYYLNKSEVVGKKASRLVTIGSLISSTDLLRNYDVRQGQTVKTITGDENFEISLQTVAQESGVQGDTIRVRNTVNQKVMSARIMDKGTVRIE